MPVPSNNKTQEIYLEARKHLNNVARSLKATKAQRRQAREARRQLTLEFIGKNIQQVEERTRQFKGFIKNMENAIKAITDDTPIAALDKLKVVVDNAKLLIAG